MAHGNGEEQIPEDRRKEIFLALVDAQDHEFGDSELLLTMNVEPLRRCVRICNEDGLHLRAAALLSQVARTFPSEISITCGGRHADAKSVWETFQVCWHSPWATQSILISPDNESTRA